MLGSHDLSQDTNISEIQKLDFQTIPFAVAESFDDPDDQLHIINKLVNECLERHCPLIRTRVTRPPAPWMRTPNIENLKLQRDKL